MIYLIIYTAENCPVCNRVVSSAKKLSVDVPDLIFKEVNINQTNKRISIVPAVFINDKLFCYGEFDDKKLIRKIISDS